MPECPKPGFIAVGKDGNRFTNEAASYHGFTRGMFDAGAIPAFLIADAAAVKKYGIGVFLPGSRSLRRYEQAGYLFSCQTLEELPGKIGVDASGLETNVARNNRFSATGIHEESSMQAVRPAWPWNRASASLIRVSHPRLVGGHTGL
jgi:hypothetical protein